MLVLDLPSPYVAGAMNRRSETVINTPYTKSREDNRNFYGFNDGFYHTATTTCVTNPVLERQAQEIRRRKQELVDLFCQVANELQGRNSSWQQSESLMPVVGQWLTLLIELPFDKVVMEATPDNSMLLKSTLIGLDVYADLTFDAELPQGHEVVLTAFRDSQPAPVVSVAGPLPFAFGRLLAFFSSTATR